MISEERLRQAAEKAGEALADSLPAPETCRETGSPAFQMRMEKLLRRARWRRWSKGLQKVAVLALVLLAAGVGVFSLNAKADEWVRGWVKEEDGSSIHYYFVGDVKEEDIVHYTIELPEGYSLTWGDICKDDGSFLYENDEGVYIAFEYDYETIRSTGDMFLSTTDDEEKKEVTVNGIKADLYLATKPQNNSTIIWADPTTKAIIEVTAFMGEEELIQLAESVRPIRVPLYDIDLPEGYVLRERTSEEAAETEFYQNDQGQWLTFRREKLAWHDGVGTAQRIGESEGKKVTVHGLSAELYSSWQKGNAYQTIAWNDPLTGVRLTLTAPMEEEALIRLAESVTAKK